MHFTRSLRAIWAWLPAFRAVAETEHLPSAAQELHVVPSSLSRTIKLLEDELGYALFERTTNSLTLNDAGRRLLLATREAMRIVDDGLLEAAGDEMRGTVTAVASPDLAAVVLPRACATLANRHADLVAATMVEEELAIPALLQRGDADVALVLAVPEGSDLVATEVATWSRSVYVRAGETVNSEAMRCVLVGAPGRGADDGWPTRLERQTAAWASDERAALDIVARTGLATVTFDRVARSSAVREQIMRLPTPRIDARTLYLLHRRAIGTHRRTDAFAEAIRVALASGELDR